MQPLIARLGRMAAWALVVLLAGCASVRPWQNLPLQPDVRVKAEAEVPAEVDDRSLAVVVSLSGGGARAAAFGYGVLDALRQTQVHWNDRDITLLDELDVISGVSGGSIIAAYYAAFGQATFPAFEQKFLRHNFQDSLISTLLDVGTLYDLTSPWLGRSHVLARRLDELYAGKTFGDLPSQPGQPRLLVSATDLSLGSSFEFTWRQFELICSDLASVPLSFAVASSSAVPMALSPMTLKNHNDTCQRPPLDVNDTARDDYRVRLLRDNQRSYLDARMRPYIHLVDGGLADNLGLRTLLDRSQADGGLRKAVRRTTRTAIQKLVIIAVNAERDPSEHIDDSDQVPSSWQVMDALLFGTGARATQETLGLLTDTAQLWRRELSRAAADGNDAFAPGAQVHVINVNLRDAPELLGRRLLLQVPTAFSIPPADVSRLIEAGRHILRSSPEFKQLMQSFTSESAVGSKPNRPSAHTP
jgi:NTE family protein